MSQSRWSNSSTVTSASPRTGVGKELNEPLDGIYSARVMREWRLLFTVNEETRTVSILAVRHRADAYRSRLRRSRSRTGHLATSSSVSPPPPELGLAPSGAVDVRAVIDRDDLDASLRLVDPVDDSEVTAPGAAQSVEIEFERRADPPRTLSERAVADSITAVPTFSGSRVRARREDPAHAISKAGSVTRAG